MTLRNALLSAELDKVYLLINERDNDSSMPTREKIPLTYTESAYSKVVAELLGKRRVKKYHMNWFIEEIPDIFDGIKYAHVCFLNTKYVAPKTGLKPWGGSTGKKMPRGYYNCNANKHNKHFGCGFTPWSKLIDTPIINAAGFSMERVVAEILWELTFYGWTESKMKRKVKEICGRIEESRSEIKSGKFVELPATKEGGFKVIIPDSVCGQLIDISNKKKKE